MSENGFILPWTDSKCIFCMKLMTTIIVNQKKIDMYQLGICHWEFPYDFSWLLYLFKADFHKFLLLFKKEITLFTKFTSSTFCGPSRRTYSKSKEIRYILQYFYYDMALLILKRWRDRHIVACRKLKLLHIGQNINRN